jgi:hypothetical protein
MPDFQTESFSHSETSSSGASNTYWRNTMNTNHRVVSELFGFMRSNPCYSRDELAEYIGRVLARNQMSLDDLETTIAERTAENDIHGAAGRGKTRSVSVAASGSESTRG